MNVRCFLIIGFLLVSMLGCAMAKHRSYVRDGLLVTGLNREAFLAEWGLPERTRTLTGEEITKAGWSTGGGFFFKGKQTYDWWTYEKRGVELVFLGLGLVAWKTEKTVEELKTPERSKPQTLDEYTKEREPRPIRSSPSEIHEKQGGR